MTVSPHFFRHLTPYLNWIALSTLLGGLFGFCRALSTVLENSYYLQPFRSIGARVFEIGAREGTWLGFLFAVAGLLVFILAWPVCLLIWRKPSNAIRAALMAVPVLTLLLVTAYKLNLEVFPAFMSIPSILGNLALIIGAVLVWLLTARWLERHQDRLRRVALNSTTACVLVALVFLFVALPMGLARLWKVDAPEHYPNVLIVLIDALRADRLGAYGYHRNTTPKIDKIANSGWRFATAVAQAPWTKPSIGSLITGLYPRQTSISSGTWAQEGHEGEVLVRALAANHITLAEVLASNGYETAAFGENHHLLPSLGFAQGYYTYDWYEPPRLGALGKFVKRFQPEFAATWINEHFINWLDANEGRKFFAYLHHIDVHWPYKSPPPFSGMYTTSPPSEDFNSDKFMIRATEGLRQDSETRPSMETLRAMSDAYDEGIRHVDSEIGRLFDELSRRGLYDKTLIIITADHGEEFMDHGSLGHGRTLYEELIRVPLIVKFPCPGPHCDSRTVLAQVELVDVFPTVMRVIGLEPRPHLAGRDLAGAVTNSAAAYSEYANLIATRMPDWKWIYDEKNDSGELYNLKQDPRELHDLANQETEVREMFTTQVLDFTVVHQRSAAVDATTIEADQTMLENLKALGYVK
jgi:arylsulfatase A-like enzyme